MSRLSAPFSESEEFGRQKGLDLFPVKSSAFRRTTASRFRTWAGMVSKRKSVAVFEGIASGDYVYFVHSFMSFRRPSVIATTTDYGSSFVSSIATERLFACQFHPEKSQEIGLRILANFGASSHRPETMLIIPAIDIKDGRCVRLFQGEMDKETIYFDRPIDAARHWVKEGATFIHVVDLNGAVEGRRFTPREVEAICKETGLSVELGGGLRSLNSVEAALTLGVSRVVVGTAAYDNQEFCALANNFQERSSSASTRAMAKSR